VQGQKWPPSSPPEQMNELSIGDSTTQDYAFIHRKGAAPTYNPSTNLPLTILPLPGSRGTPTMILEPLFSEYTRGSY